MRELNPNLFVDSIDDASRSVGRDPEPNPSTDWMFQAIQAQLKDLRMGILEVKSHIARIDREQVDLRNALNSQSERLREQQTRSEGTFKKALQEILVKVAALTGRFSQAQMQEQKTRSMLDRHNELVCAYEQKMQDLKALVREQDLKLLNTQGLLKDVRRELERWRSR